MPSRRIAARFPARLTVGFPSWLGARLAARCAGFASACLLLAACATAPTPVAVELDASSAVAAARHLSYWLEVDLDTIRAPDAATADEMDRLRVGAARLAAEAEELQQE